MSKAIKPPEFTKLINLASEKLGGKAIACSDDFFAPMANLIKPGRGVFIADRYTEHGKWMDGWESRRKRTPGHDWCIVKLGVAGVIKGFDVDTNHFLGNHPPHCSIEACFSQKENPEDAKWVELLSKSALDPGSQHFFEVDNSQTWTHVKLHIYPDGGVARLKVYGEVRKDWREVKDNEAIDLVAAVNGGKAISCNDMFFSHMDNIIMPGKGMNMRDGWETKRSRIPNNQDWVIIRLACKGSPEMIVIDTHHFKGNYPDSCQLEGCVSDSDANLEKCNWGIILPPSKLEAHHEHVFENEIQDHGPFTHVKLTIFPDGGISRLRLWGHFSKD
ncbi:MAG: allantoicase [Cyclobacteriaceae bacterium]